MPADAINIKPIIREIVRTKLRFPNIQLLVDRICIIKLPPHDDSKGSQAAYSLYLTDQEKSIQAVLKSRLHRRIHHGEIKEGSIVVLKDYELTQSKRLNGDGSIVHLKISDFYPVGQEDRPYRRFAVVGNVRKEQSDSNAAKETFLQDELSKAEAVTSKPEIGHGTDKSSHRTNEDPSSEPLLKAVGLFFNESNAEVSPQTNPQPSQKRPPDAASDDLESNSPKRPRNNSSNTNPPTSQSNPKNHRHHSPEP